MTKPTIIVGIAKAGSVYVVFDQFEQEHVATGEAELGQVIARLLNDPKIGTTEQVTPTSAKIRSAAVKIAKNMLPGYEELSEPVVDGLTAFARFLHKKATIPRPAKPPKQRPPAPRSPRRQKATPATS